MAPIVWLKSLATVVAITIAWIASRRVPERSRFVFRVAIGVLLLRWLLFGNPLVWATYRSVLYDEGEDAPRGIGFREDTTLRFELDRRKRRPEMPQRFAMGSSQVDALFSVWSREHERYTAFSLAAMDPVDYVLHEDYVTSFPIEKLILYLSELDLCSPPNYAAYPYARFRPAAWPVVWRTLRFEGKHRDMAVAAPFFAGQLLPEYRYGFLLRGLVDESLGFALAPAPVVRANEETPLYALPEGEDLLERVSGHGLEYLDLKLEILAGFLERMVARGLPVVIVEGQYRPNKFDPEDEHTGGVQADLRALAEEFDGVWYLPRSEIIELEEEDFEDDVHVTREGGLRFAKALDARLERPLDPRAR